MAALFLADARDPDFADAAIAAARAALAAQGFAGIAEKALPGWRLLHAPPVQSGRDALVEKGEELAAAAGTPVVEERVGRPALEALLRQPLPAPDWDRLSGHFAALVRRQGRAFLLTDFFAAFPVYHDRDMRIFSTSLLAAAAALPRLRFDPQGVYEFAFNAAPVGDDTVFAELKTLGPERLIELTPRGAVPHALDKTLPERIAEMPLAERIERHRARLAAALRPFVQGYGDRIFCPLSGGLDSRLLLAGLRAEGCRPSVYVYGAPGEPDVRIARAVAAGEGFALESIDKDARALPPDAFAEQVEKNFLAFDGLPNFGTLFENGANAAARAARHRDGALAASGGCGEVYRNFFYLPDRPASPAAVAASFFAQFDPADATAAFDERAFLDAIAAKLAAALGRPGDGSPLSRVAIEQLYPRVRCRALFGREIGLEARAGAYAMPFLDHHLAAEALTLPIGLKNAGRFEAMLLAAIDPALARYPSAYGHDFAGPPGLGQLFAEWSTRIRPAGLRRRTYRIRRLLGRAGDEHGGLLSPEYLGRAIDLDFPAMRRFFRPERVRDDGLFRRIANLEYLAARLGSKLVR